jgi:hypothetical protein
MVTFNIIKEWGCKWHIRHCYAMCLYGADIINSFDSRRVIVDVDKSKELGRLYVWLSSDKPGTPSSNLSDICQLCSNNFMNRLMNLPIDDVYLHRGY